MQLGGQIILTIAALITLIGPTAVDWNDSHVFNPQWPPHARFHAIVYLCMTIGFSLVALWLIWRPSSNHVADMLIAALVSILSWGSFLSPCAYPVPPRKMCRAVCPGGWACR